jgi:hypothetical protein
MPTKSSIQLKNQVFEKLTKSFSHEEKIHKAAQ